MFRGGCVKYVDMCYLRESWHTKVSRHVMKPFNANNTSGNLETENDSYRERKKVQKNHVPPKPINLKRPPQPPRLAQSTKYNQKYREWASRYRHNHQPGSFRHLNPKSPDRT